MLNEITEKHSYGGNINLNDFKEKKWEVNNKNLIYLLRVEHKGKLIPPGIYRKEIENEYDAETDEARKTQD